MPLSNEDSLPTWTVVPPNYQNIGESRSRLDTTGFETPEFQVILNDTNNYLITVSTDVLRVEVYLSPVLRLQWYEKRSDDAQWNLIASDRKTGAYAFGRRERLNLQYAHYMEILHDEEQYYGLGERAGTLNRRDQRYEMKSVDAMGYDAEKTDPLYKHFPLYLVRTKTESNNQNAFYGMFYDESSKCVFNMGQEIDNYHPKFRSFVADDGELDYYFISGKRMTDVVQRMSRLSGNHVLPPRYSLGYCGSGMAYTEVQDAEYQLHRFVQNAEKNRIPVSSFKLSSGYCTAPDVSSPPQRHVFTWNKSKFSSPKDFVTTFKKSGVRLSANVKPCVLTNHPAYEELKAMDAFIKSADGPEPHLAQFWDSLGSYLDFSNPDAVKWWKAEATRSLLDYGIDCLWNDNNEFEVWDTEAKCDAGKISRLRPIQCLLMLQASFEAQKKLRPNERVWMISRCGCPGMQRFVQTWSGDNTTEWKTLRWNQKMGLERE